MPREYRAFVKDVLEAIRKIEKYTENLSAEDFVRTELVQDAVLRNLEVIGEAVKNIPQEIKTGKSGVEWKKIAGLRDILIHAYFGVDADIVWDIVRNKIPDLKRKALEILSEIDRGVTD
jgi:uncharacterized protein with HEPN domain